MKITKNNLCLSVTRLFLSVWGRGSIKICMSLHAHWFDCERACVRVRARAHARVCVCVCVCVCVLGAEGERMLSAYIALMHSIGMVNNMEF